MAQREDCPLPGELVQCRRQGWASLGMGRKGSLHSTEQTEEGSVVEGEEEAAPRFLSKPCLCLSGGDMPG